MLTRPVHAVSMLLEALSATTMYVLVSKIGSASWPHLAPAASEIHLLGLIGNTEIASTGIYDVWFGVIIENDATDGTVQWLHSIHMEAVGTAGRIDFTKDFTLGGRNPEGANLRVVNGATTRFVSNAQLANSVLVQNDTNRASPIGNYLPAVGDLVMYVEEVSGTGTIDISITALYEVI